MKVDILRCDLSWHLHKTVLALTYMLQGHWTNLFWNLPCCLHRKNNKWLTYLLSIPWDLLFRCSYDNYHLFWCFFDTSLLFICNTIFHFDELESRKPKLVGWNVYLKHSTILSKGIRFDLTCLCLCCLISGRESSSKMSWFRYNTFTGQYSVHVHVLTSNYFGMSILFLVKQTSNNLNCSINNLRILSCLSGSPSGSFGDPFSQIFEDITRYEDTGYIEE